LCVAAVVCFTSVAQAQTSGGNGGSGSQGPSQDVEQVTEEAQKTPPAPAFTIDRPLYRALQDSKKELNEKYGINWAIEDTAIYQAGTGSIDPNDAAVNTFDLFATWKIFRSTDGKDFGGIGFQGEARQNPLDDHFTDMTGGMGTLWAPNDSTSDDYTRVNQLWWGQRLAEGRLGFMLGKIDPGSNINTNRFAGSGNTQYFSQPFATNPARSFPANGMGAILQAMPVDWLQFNFVMSDSDANANYSPFKTIDGRWIYGGEVNFRPVISDLGQGNYRLMLYQRNAEADTENGWALSADQNLSDRYGVFLRYGGNSGELNSVEHIISGGFSFLQPFDRINDQAGIGVSWTRPSNTDLRDEYSAEAYYRWQVTEGFELSGSAQMIYDPSANDSDMEGVFGVRARILY
jgi:porin